VLLIVFAVAGGLLLTMTLVTLFVFLRKDSNPAVFEEKSKMLELDSLDSSRPSEGRKGRKVPGCFLGARVPYRAYWE